MNKSFKILAIVGTAIGLIGGMISDYADEKALDEKIEMKVNEALNKEESVEC